ncbi:hypothetical protein [Pectobacterium brasiliense]|uniref:hypothetical protein n=1 Tax=Pectobacterium brasiliense TaxID=180957 RepID=UPI0012BAEF5B
MVIQCGTGKRDIAVAFHRIASSNIDLLCSQIKVGFRVYITELDFAFAVQRNALLRAGQVGDVSADSVLGCHEPDAFCIHTAERFGINRQ